MMSKGLDMGTDVCNLISKGEQGCNTQRVAMTDQMIGTRIEQASSATQARATTRDAGNDGISTQTTSQAS